MALSTMSPPIAEVLVVVDPVNPCHLGRRDVERRRRRTDQGVGTALCHGRHGGWSPCSDATAAEVSITILGRSSGTCQTDASGREAVHRAVTRWPRRPLMNGH